MILDMTIGMVLGMIASPIMMKAIKAIRQEGRSIEYCVKLQTCRG
jgi:hypothetical protein